MNTRKSPGVAVIVGAETGGQLSPMWTEWLMGYEIGWTELDASVTQSFLKPRGKRSSDSQESSEDEGA